MEHDASTDGVFLSICLDGNSGDSSGKAVADDVNF